MRPADPDGLAEYYRSRRMAFVVFTVDERLTGRRHVTNDDVLQFAAKHADVAMPFVSVDPTRGPEAVREARRLIATGLVRGLKLHPPLQQFFANDRGCVSALRGVRRSRVAGAVPHRPQRHRHRRPRRGRGPPEIRPSDAIDDVAVDFPDLPIVMAHPSFPWQDEAISICLHKPTVYIDLSGWSPKYFRRRWCSMPTRC